MKYYEQQPASGDKPTSAVIFLHGVGSNGQDLIALAPPLAEALPNTVFISPDAPFEYDMALGYPNMFQWFSLQNRAPEAMLEGVRDAQPLVDELIEEIAAKYELPAGKIALFGFSQGTMTSLFVAPRRAEKLAGIVGCSGALLAPELLSEAASKPDICLIHGEQDDVVPFSAMQIAEKTLRANGFSVQAHVRPNLPHSIDMQGIEFAKKFLSQRLNGN